MSYIYMKTLKYFSPTLLFILFYLSANGQFIRAELEVSGLTCSMCSLSTQKSLMTLDFIDKINPDLNRNIFFIKFKEGKEVNIDAIKTKVKAAGFSVNKLVTIFKSPIQRLEKTFEFHGFTYRFMESKPKEVKEEIRLQIIDKDFVPQKVFKKYNSTLNDSSYTTGFDEKKQRIYHIILG